MPSTFFAMLLVIACLAFAFDFQPPSNSNVLDLSIEHAANRGRVQTGTNTRRSDAFDYIPVASYTNSGLQNDIVGSRALSILDFNDIPSISVGSMGITISVSTSQAVEARMLLAKAIKHEGLRITLIVPEGNRYVVVTPDTVLERKMAK